eukprot:Protomagalhaensia_wolfi_Nauph_80__6245@NODE_948_length_1858_cov_182_667400_g716_i0_p1_GENE_NODE_948_length_1858_cov_182_667400_g716_i0NODE_948_length_1858_cov_182_667400_g716_i0_p1_ORF_typecomplete_len493_score104_445_nucleotid_C/PF02872_18/4_6e27DUF2532/PF10811_8/0_18_NODE_948_length_1858_cov_182_667400_g716_i02201698
MKAEPDAELTQFLNRIHEAHTTPPPDTETTAKKYIDVLMTGHSHQRYVFRSKSAADIFPVVVQASSFGRNWAVIDLEVAHPDPINPGADVIVGESVREEWSNQPITFNYDTNQWMSGTDILDENSISELLKEINEIVKTAKQNADEQGEVQQGRSDITWPAPSGSETILGAYIADALLDFGFSQDDTTVIGITNDGGVRAAWVPENGWILVRHVFNTLPFGNMGFLTTLTGEVLHEILEAQWQSDRVNPRMLQISGMRYEFDETFPMGSRVNADSMEYFNRDQNQWLPIVATEKYRVATNDFLGYGGSVFGAFTKGEDQRGLGFQDNQILQDYNAAVANQNDGWIIPPAFERIFNATLDQTADLSASATVRFSSGNAIVTVNIEAQNPVVGPFRAVLFHEVTENSEVVTVEQGQIAPENPLAVTFTTAYGEQSDPNVQFALYHEQFDNSPLPRGFEYRFTLGEYAEEPGSSGVAGHFTLLMGTFATLLIITC